MIEFEKGEGRTVLHRKFTPQRGDDDYCATGVQLR